MPIRSPEDPGCTFNERRDSKRMTRGYGERSAPRFERLRCGMVSNVRDHARTRVAFH